MYKFLFLLIIVPSILICQERKDMNTYEQISHATVQIVTIKKSEDAKGTIIYRKGKGTGFIIQLDHEEEKIELLVTNKHVVENAITGELTFTIKKENSNIPDFDKKHIVKIANFESRFIKHPDPSVDLCGIRMSTVWKEFDHDNINPFYMTIPESFISTRAEMYDYYQGSQVLMVGYPKGLIDTTNNAPIFRKGTCATAPYLDYNSREEFLIDMAVYEGSSGSPIFQVTNKVKSKKFDNEVTLTHYDDIKLIGIVYNSPRYKASLEGNKIEMGDVDNLEVKNNEISLPMNLGVVIKSYKLLELKERL